MKDGRPDPRNWIEGGDPFLTISTARSARAALCDDEVVLSQLSRHENALENLTLFSRFWEKYGDAQDERSRQRLEEALRQRLRSLGYRGSFLNSRSDVVAALMADHSPRFLKALFHSVCRDRSQNLSRIPEPFVLKVHQWENPRETRESDFSRTLRLMFSSANPQPVGIT